MANVQARGEAVQAARAQAIEPAQKPPRAVAGSPNGPGSMQQEPTLPDDCPVVALGYKGKEYYFLSSTQDYYQIHASKFTQNEMLSLYGGSKWYLESAYPRIGDGGRVTGLDTVLCYASHMAACKAKGVWDPSSRMREGGGWREPDGTFVLHCGTVLFAKTLNGAETQHQPGFFGDHVYGRSVAQPQPWPDKVTGKPAQQLLDALKTFAWRNPELDAHLLLGWCVAAMMGAALKWRPALWITGDKGTGKSTLQELLENLFGGALVHASDASAAGIYQALKLSSRPVTLDEMEAQEDNRKAHAVIQLARQASSGGLVLRGGQDHSGVEFNARSSFLFTSINHPPLEGQDLSRICILNLEKWAGVPHGLSEDKIHELGRKLLRRIMDGWPKFGERFNAWYTGLKRLQHSARDSDQYGTLLACADLALNDRIPHADSVDEEIAKWGLDRAAVSNNDPPDYEKMLTWLLTQQTDVSRRGVKSSAANLLEIFLGRVVTVSETACDEAERELQGIGLKPFFHEKVWWLAIASNHQGLARIFEGSHWRGKSGTAGVWVQAARRVPGARAHAGALRFNGVSCRVTLMPMDAVMPPEPAPLVETPQPAS